jgi:hypothetical protein
VSGSLRTPLLDPATLDLLADALADRLLERLGASGRSERQLVSAAELAAELRVERRWVYANREMLGGVALGGGDRPRLRFDLEAAREATGCLASKPSQAERASNGGRSTAPLAPGRRRLPIGLPEPGEILRIRPRSSRAKGRAA